MLVNEVNSRWAARVARMDAARQQQAQTGEPVGYVSVPVQVTVPLVLDISSGEDTYVAALTFARKHGLGVEQIPVLVNLLDKEIASITAAAAQAQAALP
jgi:hypothetical protein